MATQIPAGLVKEAFIKTCEFSGAPVAEAAKVLVGTDEAVAKKMAELKSPECERLALKIAEAKSIEEVHDIRRSERGFPRGLAIKRMIRILLIRQIYKIALKATGS